MAIGLIVAGPWYAWIAAIGVSEPAYQPVTWTAFVANIGRLPRIVALFGARAVQLDWHFLWIAVALVGIYLLLTRRPIRPLFLATAVVYLGTIMLVFVFSDYMPLEAHLLSSADRLMAHVAPLAALWLAELPQSDFGSFGRLRTAFRISDLIRHLQFEIRNPKFQSGTGAGSGR